MNLKSICLIFAGSWLSFQGALLAQSTATAVSPPEDSGHPNATLSADPGYVLQANDTVQVTVYQEDDLTTTTRVSPSGNIVLPLIGTVKVGGTSVADSCANIRAKFMDGYIRDPKITISIIEFAAKRYSVLGQVARPGSYEIPQQETLTLLDAIAAAGGYTSIADPSKVTVRRAEGGDEKILNINAKEMARDTTHKPFYVEPGDVITVGETIF